MNDDNNIKDTNEAPRPPKPEEFKIEQEWADRLGMGFDPEQAAEGQRMSQPEEIPPVYPNGPQQSPTAPQMQQTPPVLPPQMRQMPETYLVWAIISTICCCMPAGIVAIVFSSMVSSKYFARDYEGAERASRNAQIWIIAAIVGGVIANTLYFPLMLLIPS